ncbi:MAG: DUF2059 domain-containing protein [Bryobacterales bacterium]|nr:DUF2059 domain-containing protein [Bryobacterales bacterium]
MSIRIVAATSAIALICLSAPLARADEASKQKVLSELIEAMQYDKIVDQMGDVTASQLVGQLKTKHPDMDAETESKLRELARTYLSELMGDMDSMVAGILSKHFTEEELHEMLAFHRSPVGQKSLEKMPLIMQESMAWAQQKTMTSMPGLTEKMHAVIDEMETKSGQ